MATTRPQFYPNTLQPAEINKDSLENTLSELQLAIKSGVDAVRKNSQRPTDPSEHGNMYSGISGIVLTLLRLERQKPSIVGQNEDAADSRFGKLALDLLIPTPSEITLSDGRNSPIGSGLGPVISRILAACEDQNLQLGRGVAVLDKDIQILQQAVEGATKHGNVISFRGHNLGADELLFGRAGLLWAALTIQRHCVEEKAKTTIRPLLEPILHHVPKLVDTILAAGIQGSQDFEKQHSRKAPLPLMWPWLGDHYALGSVHGIAGIISILLAYDVSLLSAQKEDYLDLIADTINGLCQICIENDGHLPMSIPPMPSSEQRSSPILQLCHGSPGILVLLGAAYRNPFFLNKFWRPEWEAALHLATEQIWKEGLLSKGGNLCHGLTGNIWPLLPFHDIYDNNSIFQTEVRRQRLAELGKAVTPTTKNEILSSDYFLSRTIPFMMLARESLPYSEIAGLKPSFDFRAPDRPYCLGEGLAGEICAWAETCAVIKARLRKMQLEEGEASGCVDHDEDLIKYSSQQLGLPLFEVNGPAIHV
jgi:hypothetical protein